jgi:hypothetical protein
MTEAKEKARDDEKMTPEMRKAWGEAYCEFEQRLPSEKLMPHKSGFIAGYSAAAGQWVKIEDGLPESNNEVWVTGYEIRIGDRIVVGKATYERTVGQWFNSFGIAMERGRVIAWQPIYKPEPFTE